MLRQSSESSPDLIKGCIRSLFHKMGQSAPWLAKICLFISYPFPRLYLFISHAAGLTQIILRRTWRLNNGPLQGIKLTGLLVEEIRPVLRNEMEIRCCNLLERIDLQSQIVLDVGGSYGYYALFTSRLVGGMGLVFSFEPDWHSFARLTHNLAINDKRNIIAVPLCISNIPSGFVKWQSFQNEPWNNKIVDSHDTVQLETVNVVPITTIDYFVDKINISQSIGLIKIDVEGAELAVLQGASDLLAQTKPLILCELHGADIAQQVFDFLLVRDYQWEMVEYMNENRQHILAFPNDQADRYAALNFH